MSLLRLRSLLLGNAAGATIIRLLLLVTITPRVACTRGSGGFVGCGTHCRGSTTYAGLLGRLLLHVRLAGDDVLVAPGRLLPSGLALAPLVQVVGQAYVLSVLAEELDDHPVGPAVTHWSVLWTSPSGSAEFLAEVLEQERENVIRGLPFYTE